MITRINPWGRQCLAICIVLLALVGCVQGAQVRSAASADPAVYLDFNEGSGTTALDASGHGNAGTITGATRTESGGCGGALLFNGDGDYVSIPFTTLNHPEKEITVSAWFYVDSFAPQTLVSGYNNGGYWLGFGDGNDLWWVIDTRDSGIVSVPVQHEGITPGQWHHVTGSYDGETMKIYLDGALRNRANATGPIRYEYANYVMLGTDAGEADSPDATCPKTLTGGLDEVRIYDTALGYGQVMDDRFRCSAEPGTVTVVNTTRTLPACTASSGSLSVSPGQPVTRTLTFTNVSENGTWVVSVPPGSKLVVSARDLYAANYPDAWYVEIDDGKTRLDRSISFPNTNNAPVEGVVQSGNATVIIRYFDGNNRFPSSVRVTFQDVAMPPPRPQIIPASILSNPGIVIYSASWATLIAVLVVVIWLHRRKNKREGHEEEPAQDDRSGNGTEKKDE